MNTVRTVMPFDPPASRMMDYEGEDSERRRDS